ncbi:hypothetical protein HJG60_011018 [Phyllostomus discolor]|uniref:Uncharacterized protein n=1 Tax=Phyllostomus discolor TaxID=89673 RepID=A0A834A7F9_9CHIR|nr:hypothetical protein HJG60_011018 [Phyllostomus discolor]
MPLAELLLCGVGEGEALLPVHLPLCWALPGRQSVLGQAQFSLGVFRRWKHGQRGVSSHRRGAGNASSIIGARGRRRVRSVHLQVPLEGELRAGVGGEVTSFQQVGGYPCTLPPENWLARGPGQRSFHVKCSPIIL